MTDQWGIDARYIDATGNGQSVDADVIERLRGIIGDVPAEAPVLVRRPGGEVPAGVVELADGGELRVEGHLPPDVPLGYHRLHPDDGDARRLIISPGRCHLPDDLRAWGWAVQLYATRSRDSWGMGDLADLRRVTDWSRGAGAGFVLVNPLQAVAPTEGQQASPYFPTSRRFRNPLYLRVEEVPGAAAAASEVERCAKAGRALNDDRLIDRNAVWALKGEALRAIWAARPRLPEFEQWWSAAPDSLREFATWSVLVEEWGPDWRRWPGEYRRPDAPRVKEFAQKRSDRVRFFAWLQWLTERQLQAACADLTVIQDLPIGVDPGGFDAWAWQDVLAPGVAVGAPPDEFNTAGQNWGLPPFVPWRLAAAEYEPFVEIIRSSLASGGGLRVDHVMGLFRLWWIPEGSGAADGAYVRYPSQDLLDIVALESHRAQALVVGEDLGTVEDSAREAMAEHALLSYRLLWFEENDPTTWPRTAMAAVTTHDLPTVIGLWDGSDLQAQRAAGLEPNESSTARIRERLAAGAGLAEDADAEAVVLGAHRLLSRAPCVLLSATLDDALAEPERPNIPGGDDARANWSLALPRPIEELEELPLAAGIAAVLRTAVESPTG
jgi:4-alpha-glucanotransferase